MSFTLDVIGDPRAAWEQAHELPLTDVDVWLALIKKYEKIDRLAVLTPLREIVDAELVQANARYYKTVARRIKHMRTLARAPTGQPMSMPSSLNSARGTIAGNACWPSSTAQVCLERGR